MIDAEIIEGLKLALSKGESLKQAMMSFYNAGYKKENIEEAARNLQKENFKPQEIQQQKSEQLKKPSMQKSKKTTQKVSDYGTTMKTQVQSSQKVKQKIDSAIEELQKLKNPSQSQKQGAISSKKVSDYKGEKPKGKLITLFLIFFLLFLLGILVAVFLFKQELVDFFNNVF